MDMEGLAIVARSLLIPNYLLYIILDDRSTIFNHEPRVWC